MQKYNIFYCIQLRRNNGLYDRVGQYFLVIAIEQQNYAVFLFFIMVYLEDNVAKSQLNA